MPPKRVKGADPNLILAQFFVAFGEGAGPVRVPRGTVKALGDRYRTKVAEWANDWDTEGVQFLERVRAIGRLAALRATMKGQTTILPADFLYAARSVESTSSTPHCAKMA